MNRALPSAGEFPAYARFLSTDWRRDIRAVAQRQPGWVVGCHDAALLAAPVYQQTRTHGIVLLYGAPALLALPRAVDLLRTLDAASFALALRRSGRVAGGELALVGRLRAGLIRLGELNSEARAPAVEVSALPAQCDARARAASFPYFVTWLPGAAEGLNRESGRTIGG